MQERGLAERIEELGAALKATEDDKLAAHFTARETQDELDAARKLLENLQSDLDEARKVCIQVV